MILFHLKAHFPVLAGQLQSKKILTFMWKVLRQSLGNSAMSSLGE